MNTRNQQVLGALAESRFVSDYILSKGLPSTFIKASYTQDRTEHWDVSIDGVKIDIKAKRRSRTDSNISDKYALFEFVNVSGTKGWGVGGADKIAYEFDDIWIVINREALHHRVRREIHPEDVATAYSAITPYKLSTRNNKDDVYVWFPITVLFEEEILDYMIDKIVDDTRLYHLNT